MTLHPGNAQCKQISALEPASAVCTRTGKSRAQLVAPKRLAFPAQASMVATVAAGGLGGVASEVASMCMARPAMAATGVFDFILQPNYPQAEHDLSVLMDHFSKPFAALGGNQ